ncbi:hypothetical protein F0P96_12725 [Hymenobacter busanensis]|uniref:Uncharacterized protein n=1 Tax=Hymenobacter busanensis TaxID=2607656 RepID=A0A7L4ZWB4_9BACT|nr:hypothetical protein [Hymenobacter busanensis]KAA9332336.1 hypothetical protein F0P96_12725 [Hymenobacter busanensis]QHJ07327.1 hypothetical protein GUY19_08550 [Hymenobacter busanensis]
MKKLGFQVLLWLSTLGASAQDPAFARTKFVIGLSAPELLHVGVGIDATKYNQLGLGAGVGPSWGTLWPSLSAEHRLYFGKTQELTNRKQWFFRQGATYFPAGDEGAGTLSIGIDFKSKRSNSGWTIDAGMFWFYPQDQDRYYNSFPALRFQHYSYFRKGAGG